MAGAGLVLGVVTALLPTTATAALAVAPPNVGPATVTADALPTVQVDGVVWAQVVVGDRVYVTGDFDNARPAGAVEGTNLSARANVLAYDLRTGELVTSWNASLNAQGLAIAASPDGSRIYVGGDFTQANGATRNRIVAFDAVTGALAPGFAPGVSGRVRTIVAADGVVYAGGSFFSTGGQARTRLAAFAADNGALQTWAPVANGEVHTMVAPSGVGTMVIGGAFTTLAGVDAYGHGAVDLAGGEPRPFASNQVVRNAGAEAAIWNLATDGAQVYGTGYAFRSNPNNPLTGNLENTFAADARTGELRWVNGCLGDTYGVAPVGGVLYSVGHAHDCSPVGGNPETSPRTFQRAIASTTAAGAGTVNNGGAFSGLPAPQLLHWLPTLALGTTTGQYQAAWSIAASDDYVVLGGEFPRVNGTRQQGLVRFAVPASAPKVEGPQGQAELTPTAAVADTGVELKFRAAWDRDDQQLTYDVLRGDGADAPVVATATSAATWWDRPALTAVDPAPPAGITAYRVRVSDAAGNAVTSVPVTIDVPATAGAADRVSPAASYADLVRSDGADYYWPLDDDSTTTAADVISGDSLLFTGTKNVRGLAPRAGAAGTATKFPGSAKAPAATQTVGEAPTTFTTEAWFSTRSTRGGKIIGFGNAKSGLSTSYDRHVMMTEGGQLFFGVFPGSPKTIETSDRYNDGEWHHVVASMGGAGMELYVDGARVAADPSVTTAKIYPGYWRIAGDQLGKPWKGLAKSKTFNGTLDDVAVYPTALGADRIAEHYRVGTGVEVADGARLAQAPAEAATSLSAEPGAAALPEDVEADDAPAGEDLPDEFAVGPPQF